ncbi:hypothetical protein RDV64_21915 [Acuticoccus sp. MNP-M23]|uniref:hypothetical protein n=1 Tax=Acuticoccus sp. MNP-M23 TaxID=3072793 RepID=UPI002814A98B|nr:hypothetical protein [Acuticoccus sp. MNP-M23]WMS42680.1 hypothetical protein RDV64_21915 [Acuticoccus sp. MNP-M23]
MLKVAAGFLIVAATCISAAADSYSVSDVGSFESRSACMTAAREVLTGVAAERGGTIEELSRSVAAFDLGSVDADVYVACVPLEGTSGATRGFLSTFRPGEDAGALHDMVRDLFNPDI